MRCFSLAMLLLGFIAVGAQAQTLNSADEYSQRGIARFEKNDLPGAIADFTKAIEMEGGNREFCYYFRGIARYRQGNLDEAIGDLSKAIALKPHPRFYDDRGNLLAKKGDFEGAIADLNKAIEVSPDYAKAYGDRGLVRLMLGEDKAAEADFRKCFELDRSLEAQITAAAGQIKQRTSHVRKHEPPADVKIVKFSWAEVPISTLTATQPSIEVPTVTLSATGTRILAGPVGKGDPGPEILERTQLPPGGREPSSNTKTSVAAKFALTLKNVGDKTIVGVRWAFVFYPKDMRRAPVEYVFLSRTNISPGKEKNLSETRPAPDIMPHAGKLSGRSDPFTEGVIIHGLEFADGTSWVSRPSTGSQ